MMQSAQFLHMVTAEDSHLINISIHLPPQIKADFERRLNEAFASDGFSDSTRAWNEERARVVQDVLEQHLIPAGTKWAREYIREEVEDFLATHCASVLRDVGRLFLLS
jgi:transcription elongation factor SPT6